jgi:hypothetical protein
MQYVLRGICYSCDDEVKVIYNEHSLHLSQGSYGFLLGSGFRGVNLPVSSRDQPHQQDP